MTVRKPLKKPARKRKPAAKRPAAGRPKAYTPRIAAKICAGLADGKSLRSICSGAGMPSRSTVLLWVVDGSHPEFTEQYRLAREAAGYAHADSIIETVEKLADNKLDPSAARGMLDGLKWAAERMAPKAHSPRSQISGPDEKPLIPTDQSMTEEQLREELEKRGLPTILFDQ